MHVLNTAKLATCHACPLLLRLLHRGDNQCTASPGVHTVSGDIRCTLMCLQHGAQQAYAQPCQAICPLQKYDTSCCHICVITTMRLYRLVRFTLIGTCVSTPCHLPRCGVVVGNSSQNLLWLVSHLEQRGQLPGNAIVIKSLAQLTHVIRLEVLCVVLLRLPCAVGNEV